MTIERYDDQPLTGRIVCRESRMTLGMCGMPTRVLNETPLSITIQDLRDGDKAAVRKCSVLIVCDTPEEGWRVYAVAQEHLRNELAIQQVQVAERRERWEAAMAKAVAS